MKLELERARLALRFRDMIRLEEAAGARLQILLGSVWITQEGDRKDYYLPAAGTITLERPGLVLVHALEPAEMAVWRPAPQISGAAQAARGLARMARTLATWVARRLGPGAIAHSPGP